MITALQFHFRRHGKLILSVVAAVVVVSMLWFGPARTVDDRGGVATLYGKTMTRAEFESVLDSFAFGLMLQMGRPVNRNDLSGENPRRQIFLQLAMAEKARRMGIRVTDEEVAAQIRAMPIFQVGGRFRQERFGEILSSELPKRRLNEQDVQRIIADQIAVQRLDEMIASTALVAPEEVDRYVRLLNERIDASVAKFDQKKYTPSAPPPEEALLTLYKSSPEKFRVGRQVKVMYVEFPIAPVRDSEITEASLRAMYENNLAQFITPDRKVKSFEEVKPLLRKAVAQQVAMDATGKRATDFSLKFATDAAERPDFRSAAGAEGLKVRETALVSEASQLKEVDGSEQFLNEVMKLSKDNPVSLPIVGRNGIYVAHWLDGKESYVPEFAAVKARVLEMWKNEEALKAAREAGMKARDQFRQLLSEGRTADQAIKQLGLVWEKMAPFVPKETSFQDLNRFAKRIAMDVPAGGVSEFQADPYGGIFVFVRSRTPSDPAKALEDRTQAAAMLQRKAQQLTLLEFRRRLIDESGLAPLFSEPADPDRAAM